MIKLRTFFMATGLLSMVAVVMNDLAKSNFIADGLRLIMMLYGGTALIYLMNTLKRKKTEQQQAVNTKKGVSDYLKKRREQWRVRKQREGQRPNPTVFIRHKWPETDKESKY